MTRLIVRHAPSVQEWAPGVWNSSLRPENVHVTYAGLRLAEKLGTAEISYLIGSRDDSLVAAVPLAIARAESRWLLGRPDVLAASAALRGDPAAHDLLDRGDPSGLLPSLVCGGRHMGFSCLLHGNCDQRDLDALLDEVEHVARQDGLASISWPFLPESWLLDALEHRGYVRHHSGDWYHLDLPGTGSTAGCAHPLAHGRASREYAALRRRGVRTDMSLARDVDLRSVALVETAHLSAHGHSRHETASLGLLQSTIDEFGDDVILFSASVGQQLAAFALFIRSGDELFPRQCGVAAGHERSGAFIAAALYAPIERASELGVTRVHVGFGSDEMKRRRGYMALPQFAMTKRMIGS